jgi:hypothetical protein
MHCRCVYIVYIVPLTPRGRTLVYTVAERVGAASFSVLLSLQYAFLAATYSVLTKVFNAKQLQL